MSDFRYYKNRRLFSNAVHVNMASKVYEYLGWQIDDSRGEIYKEQADIKDGIDYYLLVNGFHRTVQERFRTSNYEKYTDVTFRYQYPDLKTENQNSEWFKITADYFLYGIIQQNTTDASEIKPSGKFKKLVLLDLRLFTRLVDNGRILIGKKGYSYLNNSKLYGGVRSNVSRNTDNRSTFVFFDVKDLYQLDNNLIIIEKGYGTPVDILKNYKK